MVNTELVHVWESAYWWEERKKNETKELGVCGEYALPCAMFPQCCVFSSASSVRNFLFIAFSIKSHPLQRFFFLLSFSPLLSPFRSSPLVYCYVSFVVSMHNVIACGWLLWLLLYVVMGSLFIFFFSLSTLALSSFCCAMYAVHFIKFYSLHTQTTRESIKH